MTEIEVYQPPAATVVRAQDIDSWTVVAGQVIKLANEIYDTPFVPDGLRGSVPATAAAILAGRELGLGPMTSLANVHVIKGKPALSAALMRALILAQGHQIETLDISDTRCVIRGRRRGESSWEEASFTADQAKRAGIQLGGYPQDKLYARATSRLARRKFADVIAGMPYSAEELEDGDEDHAEPPAAENGTAPKPAQRTAQRQRAPERPTPAAPAAATAPPQPSSPAPATAQTAPSGLPPLPGEDEATESVAPATETARSDRHRRLTGIVHQHFKRLGFADDERDHRLATTATLAGIAADLESSSELTEEQLSAVADTLSRCRDRDQLIVLLAAGDKPERGDG